MVHDLCGARARRFGPPFILITAAILLFLQAQAHAQTPSAASPTFQVDVNYVDVDVVVTDEDGNFVRGLSRDDFELLEDGKPAQIETFSVVEIPSARKDRSDFEGVVPDVRTNRSSLAGRFYVIVLDDIGTSALRSPYLIRAARLFVEQHFAPNDTAAVVYTSGRRDHAQEFTSDRSRLLAAIDKFAGTKLRSSTLDKLDGYYQQKALAQGLASQMGGEAIDPASDLGRAANPFSRGVGYASRSFDLNDLERGHRALGVLGQLKRYADFLVNIRGRRKAMLLFSEGIDYPVGDIFSAHDASNVVRATEDLIAAAARSNVNLFTIDPRGLVGLTSEYIELSNSNSELFNVGARDDLFGLQPQMALLTEMRLTQDSLRTLAEETGGLAVVDTNSFESAFSRIVQANSLYYMLGYAPPHHPRDGRLHSIEIRVKRPGLRWSARKGYVSPRGKAPAERARAERLSRDKTSAADRTSLELRELLGSPLQQGGVTLDVQAAPFKTAARLASVALAIEVDGARLSFLPRENGVFANNIELSLFSIDEGGKSTPGIRTELDLALRPDTYRRVKTHGLRINTRTELSPGRYQLRVGVRESGAGGMGTVFHDLDVPDFTRDPLMISGVLLSAASARRVPTLQADEVSEKILAGAAASRRTFLSSDELAVYAELYENVSNQSPRHIDVTTSLVDDTGREVLALRETLAGSSVKGTRSVTHALSRNILLKGIAPGRYVLRIEARLRGREDRAVVRETTMLLLAE